MDLKAYWIFMLTEHKKRQALYLNITQKPDDSDKEIVIKNNTSAELIQDILDYFINDTNQLIYPSKSYAVAIIYSHLIFKYFGVDIYKSLKDKDLFLGTDKFFAPYNSQTRHIYNRTLKSLKQRDLLDFEASTVSQVKSSVGFFAKEFFLDHADLSSIYLSLLTD